MSEEVKMTKVVSKCARCGKLDEFEIPQSGLQARSKGVPLHEAFPDLPEHRIQQLATHLCEACQGKRRAAVPKFEEGQMVTLVADTEEGWVEQRVELMDVLDVDWGNPNQCIAVCVPIKDRTPDDVDGMCEVTLSQVKEWVESVNAGYNSLPGAAEDERTSMAARRTTCVCCNHGDHEVSLGKGESCDCPCHGGYGAEYQSKDRLRR